MLQYISEYIKLKGFDGVMYTSAFSRNILPQIKSYKNIAIFNYSNCEAINSKLYMIDKVDLIYRDMFFASTFCRKLQVKNAECCTMHFP